MTAICFLCLELILVFYCCCRYFLTVMKLECGHKSIGVFAAWLEIQRDETRVDEDRRPADESEEKERKRLNWLIQIGRKTSFFNHGRTNGYFLVAFLCLNINKKLPWARLLDRSTIATKIGSGWVEIGSRSIFMLVSPDRGHCPQLLRPKLEDIKIFLDFSWKISFSRCYCSSNLDIFQNQVAL